MNQALLVIDSHYLCHRAFHSSRGLSYKGQATGVLYGFFQALSVLQDRFDTMRLVFCFEHSDLFRRNLLPDYKRKRHSKPLTKEEAVQVAQLREQIALLRETILPKVGFKNVLCVRGFESDDLMASVSKHGMVPNSGDECVIVTSDADLFQCLRHDVSIWSPQKNKVLSASWFTKEHGIPPKDWALVKAIAGCTSDGVPGVVGIGEKTALKYLLGKSTINQRKKIETEWDSIVTRNWELVKLPGKDCPKQQVRANNFNIEAWREVCREYGMKSLERRPPVPLRMA